MRQQRFWQKLSSLFLTLVISLVLLGGIKTVILALGGKSDTLTERFCGCTLPPTVTNGAVLIIIALLSFYILFKRTR